ncbi:MAG: ABC transporter ATP-binding protein [Bacteroidales bacterium]|nr:ABC transporter ATP-binding protein [Bacteroidales bacterium]
MNRTIAAQLSNAGKEYKTGDTTLVALQPTTINFNKGEVTLIVGPSGSGKTTLLSLLGCVIYPTSGDVWLGDTCVSKLSENQQAELRLNHIGFVFQGFNLIAPLSSLENVMQPLLLKGVSRKTAKEKAMGILRTFGIEDRAGNLPKTLSGGQQQRVAVARALITNPELILCDEPTASLDHQSAIQVMKILQSLSRDNRAVIVVTHDMRLKNYADRIIYVIEGKISNNPIETEF